MSEDFKWTDELVKEFANNLFVDKMADDCEIHDFKRTHAMLQSNKDWEIQSLKHKNSNGINFWNPLRGWKIEEINLGLSQKSNFTSQIVNTISEKDYPIQKRWIIAQSLVIIPFFLLFMLISIPALLSGDYAKGSLNGIIYTFFFPISLIILYLNWKNFHFQIEDKFMVISQGIIKKQQRNLPFSVIQDVVITQKLLDRVVGVKTLVIQNASQTGIKLSAAQLSKQENGIGFSSSKVNIPGLNQADAETLKNIILERVKQNQQENAAL